MIAGMIIMWNPAGGPIPDGWAVCDGTQGTPNIQSTYLRGASTGKPPGTIEGTLNHQHNFTADPHGHELQEGEGVDEGVDFTIDTDDVAVVGTTGNQTAALRFFAIDFIMKL